MIALGRSARLIAAAALAGTAALGLPTAPATASTTPTHVAIVVAGVGSACVPAGDTGLALLESKYDVVVGNQSPYVGFVLKINRTGTTRPDNTHYWAYFHATGSGWTYSGTGAASYYPRPGTIEGWAFDNGSNPAPSPPATSYATICAGQDKKTTPSSPPTRPFSTRPAQTTSAARRYPATGRADPTPASPTAAASGAHASRGPKAASTPDSARRNGAHARADRTPTSPASSTPAGPTEPSGGRSARALQPAPPVSRHSTSAIPAWGTVLGLTAVAAMGAAAYWRTRKQRT